MKINLKLIEKLVEAGASAPVILAYLREQDALQAPRKEADRVRKSAESKRKRAEPKRNGADASRETLDAATISDTPRARLFREGKGALLTLGVTDNRAGGLIAQWLKLTHDDEQLVTATILQAQQLAVADAPSWILATLKGKTDGNRPRAGARQSGGADFFAGLKEVAADIARDSGMAGPADAPIPRGRVDIDG